MDFMDIHICGACRTQFNVVEHFIAHKQLCPMLNQMKRQAKIDSGDADIESREEETGGKILYNDLSMILSRGTSINLQTVPCPPMSGHSATPLRQSLQESQNYPESAAENTGIASFQSTFSRSQKHSEVITHQDLDHPNVRTLPNTAPEETDHQRLDSNSQTDYGNRATSDSVENRHYSERRDHSSRYAPSEKRPRDIDRSADPQLIQTSYTYHKETHNPPDQRTSESFRSPKHRKLHYESQNSSDQPHMILNPGDFQNEMRFSKEKVKYHLENDVAPPRETVLRKPQSVIYAPQTEQVNYHQPETARHLDLGSYEPSRNTTRSYQGHQQQNFSEHEPYRRSVEGFSNLQHHQQLSNVPVQEQAQFQHEVTEIQTMPEDAETLGHHDYYAPQHPEASYAPLENVQIENSPNNDHQYLSSYKPEQAHGQESEAQASGQRQERADEAEPTSLPKRLRSRETRQKAADLDILKQALKSGNVNLEEGEMNEAPGDQLAFSNSSNLNPGLPIEPPSNLALLASTLQEHADPLYSSTLVPPVDSILTTDVEMVSVCPIDPMDTEDGTESAIVTMSQPKYVVVKGNYEKKADKKGTKEKGGKTRIHECDFKDCDFTTTYAKDIERHIRTHTGEKPFICNYCNKTFNRSDKLKIHIRLHTGEKPFRCSYCEYAAVDSSSLKKHVRTHTDERPFKCQICSYASKNSSQLVVHLRTHTGDSPFQCGICQAKFKINSDLKRHGRIHTGEKPYKCHLCDYKCSIKANLKTHLKINHSEENKITCSQCSFSSSSKKVMREHGKVHDTSTTYECDLCKYISNSKSALATHRRVHSEERPYPCDFCSYKSKQIGNIKTHIKKKHSDRLKHSKYFVRTEKSPEHSSTSNESSPNKNFGRNAYKCNICTASFVRADSLRSHTRQHCRDIAMNLETTALAVLQLQNSASPKKSESRTPTKDRSRSESRASHSGSKVSPRKPSRNHPSKSTCGLQDIADAAVKLSHMPDNVKRDPEPSQVVMETSEPMEQQTMVESQQLIQGQQIIQFNQPIRVQQTQTDSTNQVSQIVSLDTQSILNNPDQMVELPNGEWISLKQLITGQMVTQVPINQQITQYQVPGQTEQQFSVQVIPQQTVQQHVPVSLPGQPQIQIILPSHFINQNQDGGMNTSAVAANNPQILIQLQDPNALSSLKHDNQQQTILASFPQGGQPMIQTGGNLTPLNLQEVVVQMELPPSGENIKTGECQSETN